MAMDWSFLGGYDQGGQYKMNPEFIKMLANVGNRSANGASVGQMLGGAAGDAVTMRTLMGQNPQLRPTPTNMPGPNKITQTSDANGTSMKIDMPHPSQIQGSNIPIENQTLQNGGVSDQSPFWKALLGQMS